MDNFVREVDVLIMSINFEIFNDIQDYYLTNTTEWRLKIVATLKEGERYNNCTKFFALFCAMNSSLK